MTLYCVMALYTTLHLETHSQSCKLNQRMRERDKTLRMRQPVV